MPAIYVSEETIINKPINEVYAYVRDFEKWPEWSPWLICEKETKLSFQKDSYSWEGKVVGAGEMSVASARENQQIDYKLEFLKPWKSKADVCIKFEPSGDGTKVKWIMDSSLPWFMFFMKGMMECMIGMDYQRGLCMLKERLETGRVLSDLSYDDRIAIPACNYIGIQRTCAMTDMERAMGEDFEKIAPMYAEKGDHNEPMFTIYSQWKPAKGLVNYTVCCPVEEIPTEEITGMIKGQRPATDVFAVTHKGPYSNLGNAWSAAMMRAQAKLFKQSKAFPPFEQYISNPEETSDAELLTRVCLPRKD